MNNYNLKDKLARYIDAGFPIIYINSFEENKIDEIIKSIESGKDIMEWNGSNGLVDFKTKTTLIGVGYSLEDTLEYFKNENHQNGTTIVLKDVHSQLEDSRTIALLKEIAININSFLDATIIIVSSILSIPKELEKYITILDMDYMNELEIKDVILQFTKKYDITDVNPLLLEEMILAFKGLSEFEIKNILNLAYVDNAKLSYSDLSLVFDQKHQIIKKSGILEMIPLKESLDEIGGLENLKIWLNRKAKIFKNINRAKEFGVDMPKGVLIVGSSGCGKSLTAKASAKLFEIPLLRLDMGRLMGKYVGESEANMRKAVELAETISPCVLWIDEIEKAFAGIGGDGGGAEVTTRLFGNFLTWMQEKDSPTFVVATANDITKLPPELLRKGRFDEIFYVELPNSEERKKIFDIHIGKRRKNDLNNIDLNRLASKEGKYSGADIEGFVKESIEIAFFDDKTQIKTEDILRVIENSNDMPSKARDKADELIKEYKIRNYKKASK